MNFLIKLWQCFFCWRVNPSNEKELADCQVILGQSFGRQEFLPGASNWALSRVIKNLPQLPVVLQQEIADSLPYEFPKYAVISEHRKERRYLDTFEVLSQASAICRKKGWSKVIIVAHPDHAWRVARCAERLGFTIAIANTSAVPYDPESVQGWTKSRGRFIPYEIGARLVFLARGWI